MLTGAVALNCPPSVGGCEIGGLMPSVFIAIGVQFQVSLLLEGFTSQSAL